MLIRFCEKFPAPEHRGIGVLIFLAYFILLVGCSVSKTVEKTTDTITKTTRKIVREVTFAGDGLKKVVAVAGFENKCLQSCDGFQTAFHKDVINYLSTECDELIVSDSGKLTQLPKMASGQTDNYALAVIGRQLGVNAVIAGSLNNIRPLDEEQGILWTKETRYLLEVLIRVAVYDMQTATKTLDESFTQKVEIDETQHRLIQEEGAYNVPQINEALQELVSEMSDRICEVMDEQNWNGYVTAVEEDKIIISTGGPVGLKQGHVLEVFDSGRILEGIDGQRFFSPGQKTAELEIVAVSEKQAEAVKLTGREFKVGSIVRKK